MKYSIITVNYNNKEGLRQTIESVIHQTFRDFEFIVIDGGSNDGSADVLREYDQQLTYWVSESDKGIYNAMNKGIRKATGDYLNFMNSGDCFYDNNRLQIIENLHLESDMIIGSDYWVNPQTGEDFQTILPLRLEMFTFYKGSLPHQSTFFKRTLFNNDYYNENMKVVSDWIFYIQKIVGEGCSVAYYNGVVCRRDPKDGVGYSMMQRSKEEREAFIKEFLPVGIQKHYETLSHLDNSTFCKLMTICDDKRSLRYLTIAIKVLFRLFFKR